MIEAYKKYWKGYIDFKGRSTVSDYWWTILCNIIAVIVLTILERALGLNTVTTSASNMNYSAYVTSGPIVSIWTLATLIPDLAIEVRRLRDIGKGWGWLFISLVPLAGPIWFLVLMCKPSVNPVAQTAGVAPQAMTTPVMPPVEPTAPVAPQAPVAPVETTAPVEPMAPTAPVETAAPVEPTAPLETTTPVDNNQNQF